MTCYCIQTAQWSLWLKLVCAPDPPLPGMDCVELAPLTLHNATMAAALALMFLLYKFDLRAGGALAALVLGMMVSVMWSKGATLPGANGWLSLGPNVEYAREVGWMENCWLQHRTLKQRVPVLLGHVPKDSIM